MKEWSYPIGEYEWTGDTSREARQRRIEQIAAAPGELRSAVAGLTAGQLDTPYREGGWTARQVAHHVADAATQCDTRLRLALTENEPLIKPFEENDWVLLHDASTMDPDVSVRLLEALTERMTALLRSLPDEAFSRTFRHPANGVWTIDRLISYYAWHGRHHAAQIAALRRRNGW